jgi:hypothetical protein
VVEEKLKLPRELGNEGGGDGGSDCDVAATISGADCGHEPSKVLQQIAAPIFTKQQKTRIQAAGSNAL